MASSSDRSVTESIRDDFLTCHICFEVFTDPRILPCLHTYCFQCICAHVDTNQTEGRPTVCPECREPISDVVSSLKTNFFINGLTEVVKVKSDESLKCTACFLRGTESRAKVKCLDCGDYLCSTCSDGHNASSLTWKHEKIPLDDIKRGTFDEKLRQLQKIKCLKHEDKDVEYYCESCCQPVCLTCVLITHRDHKCQTVPDAITQRKTRIISLTENIRVNLSKLEQKESNVQLTLDTTKRIAAEEIISIEEKAKEEISRIIATKEDAIREIKAKSLTTEKEQESGLEEVRLQKGVVGSCLNFCDNILEKGRDEEILMLEKMITERLGQLQGHGCETSIERSKKKKRKKKSGEVIKKVLETSNGTEIEGSQELKCSVSNEDINENKLCNTSSACANESDSVEKLLKKFKDTHMKTGTSEDNITQRLNLRLSKIFIIQHDSDTTTPDIKGLAFSTQTGIVLSDKANKTIKIYSTAGLLKRILTMDSFTPFAVAIVGDIIGVISENYLYLLKESGGVMRKILIHTQKPNSSLHFTFALTASDEEFIVGNIPDENRLRVYNLDGTMKKLIPCYVQYPLRSLSFTNSGHIVTCDWGGGYVKVLSSTSNVKTKCQRMLQWKPDDACVSKEEAVFVADYDFGGICIFDKSGNLLLEHSTACDGVRPTSVVFDDQERLYVAGKHGYVSVYDIVRTV